MLHLILVGAALLSFLVYSYPCIKKQQKLALTDPARQSEESLRVIQKILRRLFRLSGSELTVIGRENIPDGAVLYVGNHRSYFDIVTLYPLFPKPTGFVAKKEMSTWATLADWMRLGNCVFMNRKDLKEGLKAILESVEKIKAGISLVIFPEGTRNTSEDIRELMPFHEGSMKIATKSGCPVIPVAITGTRDIFERQFPCIRPSKVTVEFGKPIYIRELSPEDRKYPGAYVRGKIIEMLNEEQIRRG